MFFVFVAIASVIGSSFTEEEKVVVKPGSVVEFSFRTSETKKAKPEINRIIFAKK